VSRKAGLFRLRAEGAPCPAEHAVDDLGDLQPALADLVLELEEQAELRRGTGAEIRVTGDEVVTRTAGEDLDLVGHATTGDSGRAEGGTRRGGDAQVAPGATAGSGAAG